MNLDPSRQMAPRDLDISGRPPFDEDADYYSPQPSSPEPEEDENEENEEPRRFEKGDRVRVNDDFIRVDEYLQKDNRIGTIVEGCYISIMRSYHYWIKMDKPVKKELISYPSGSSDKAYNLNISRGYTHSAYDSHLELVESYRFRVGDKVKVLSKSIDTEIWKNVVENFENGIGCVAEIHGDPYTKSDEDNCIAVSSENYCTLFAVSDLKLIEPVRSQKPLDPRLKNLIKTALELFQTIETTFKKSKKYPIFGMNLKNQKPVTRTQKPNLGESLYSLGVVLYHLFTGESEHNNLGFLLDEYPKPKDVPEEFWEVVMNKLFKSEYRSLSEFKEDLKYWKEVLKQTNKDSSQEKAS